MSIELFKFVAIKPFASLGLTADFWTIHIDTLIFTWVAMLLMAVITLVSRPYLHKNTNLVSFSLEKGIGFFVDLCKESFAVFKYNYFAFISTIFLFTFFCCLVCLLPYMEESTKDINTTLAISLTSFLYVIYHKIKVHGFIGFLEEFAQPFIVLAPIHIVGDLSRIASMSFRLFGNIMGGSVIFTMITAALEQHAVTFVITVATILLLAASSMILPFGRYKTITAGLLGVLFLLTYVQMFVGIFEGLIQAFVLTMLTTTYLALGVAHEEHEGKEA